MKTVDCDFLVVGSGLAGLSAARKLAARGSVALVTKREVSESNTNYAQGGVSCVTLPEDSFDRHVADTLDAGAGLCREDVVRAIVEDGPARMQELREAGVRFDLRPDGVPDLGREGGHTMRRILHAGDITGREIERALVADARRLAPRLRILEHTHAIDLVTVPDGRPGDGRACIGAYMLDARSGAIFAVRSPHTVLATGGAGKVYLYTCNPDVATAGGIAMAWRAGADIRNMEFFQFHPTCLYHPEAKSFLVSEAVRGEGAKLVDASGATFMERYDRRGSLAPRDIVARAIDHEMKTRGLPCMYLDIRHKGEEFLRGRFPNIYAELRKWGVDMARDLVPVVPAAHYCCGGVAATVEGRTNVRGLYAVGETANTGLHGANRLASNSLLEAAVCGAKCAEWILANRNGGGPASASIPPWDPGPAVPSDELVVVNHNWDEVRTCMWDYVGIVRSDKRLERALRRIENLRREIRQYYFDYFVTSDVLELRNIADAAWLIVRSALARRESRGLHFSLDCPDRLPEARDTVISNPFGPGRRP
ncbi:MAG: L-aspartate oxidase [Kiritimatiellae bacterium]|nr:L-aspartate oxidase [Kiritimatiellia bacterium]